MRVLIVSAMLLAALCVACDAQYYKTDLEEAQDTFCKWEWKDFHEFNDAVFDPIVRREKWMEYLRVRDIRKNYTSSKGIADCSYFDGYGDRVFVLDDQQLFERLCREEQIIGGFIANDGNDALINAQLQKLQENVRSYREEFSQGWLNRECRDASDIKLVEQDVVRIPYPRFYQECRNAVVFDYLWAHMGPLEEKSRSGLIQSVTGSAGYKTIGAKRYIKEKCTASLFECCGEELVIEARDTAPVKSIQWMLTQLPENKKLALKVLEEIKNHLKNIAKIEAEPKRVQSANEATELISKKVDELKKQ